jgi:hypothetical protein
MKYLLNHDVKFTAATALKLCSDGKKFCNGGGDEIWRS